VIDFVIADITPPAPRQGVALVDALAALEVDLIIAVRRRVSGG
jgi:hypothetical protein